MPHSVVGVFSASLDKTIEAYHGRYLGPIAKYRRVIWYTANPRTEQYMRDLFQTRAPEGTYVNADTDNQWESTAAAADEVLLLYPDAIGLEFARIERKIARSKKDWAVIRVLNGRRREFVLTSSVATALRWRRALSRLMVGEAIFTLFFIIATPVFLILDFIGGRK
jgi:hypothetical protein